jgi:Domain of unknown function (DUF4382)/Domain of unknown function (DUF5666)
MESKKHSLIARLCAFFALVAVIFGCGGGGGGSSSALDVFITDGPIDGYSHVWVKVYKAEIYNSAGTSTTVFESTDGLTVDLRALNDGAARFLLLAPGRVPDGTYTKAEFVLDKNVTMTETGTGASSVVTFPTALDSSAGKSKLELNLTPPLVIPGTASIVADFDLSTWDLTGTTLTPNLKRHNGVGLGDINRHHRFEFHGIVGSLAGTSPDLTFTLTLRTGGDVGVVVDSNTSIVYDDGLTAIANGNKVEIYGIFDPTTKQVKANLIKVESTFDSEPKAIGNAHHSDVSTQSFKLNVKFARGFAPGGEYIFVETSDLTVFRGRHGASITKDVFYASLAAIGDAAVVEVEGSFNATTNTFRATKVHLEDSADIGEAEAKGTSGEVLVELGKFKLAVTEVEGFTVPGDPEIWVKTMPNAEYKDKTLSGDDDITKEQFFASIGAASKTVKVHGAFDGSFFRATKLEIRN